MRWVTIENYQDSVTIDPDYVEYSVDKLQGGGTECGVHFVQGWQVHHFEPAGKKLGVGGVKSRNSASGIAELHDKYGFTYWLQGGSNTVYNWAIDAGFQRDNMMVSLPNLNRGIEAVYTRIQQFGSYSDPVYAFYVGEPVENEYSLNDYTNVWIFLKIIKQYPSLFITDEWHRTSDFESFARIADKVMCSGYDTYWLSSQLDRWQDFKGAFGSKFNQTWICERKDQNEYYELFRKAKSLGLNPVWCWQGDGSSDYTLEKFCNNAFWFGYLKRYSKKVWLKLKCYANVDPCDCPTFQENPNVYLLQEILPYYPTTIVQDGVDK
jgi:hypothetical protein